MLPITARAYASHVGVSRITFVMLLTDKLFILYSIETLPSLVKRANNKLAFGYKNDDLNIHR